MTELSTTRKRSRTCATCKASHSIGSAVHGKEQFECRRRAPTQCPDRLDMRSRRAFWPLVLADEWCAEYAER